MKNIHNWVFHFNTYTQKWEAVKREHYSDLFSKQSSPHILRSSNVNHLAELIERTDGDKDKIEKLLGKII